MNFLSKIIARFVSKSFVQKHITSVFTYLSGLITALSIVSPSLLVEWVSINVQVFSAVALYFISAWIDSKPEKPELINK